MSIYAKNTILSEVTTKKNCATLEIIEVDKGVVEEKLFTEQNRDKYIRINITEMSVFGEFDFTIRSSPEWLRDEGKGVIQIRDFDFNIHLLPSSNEGSIFLEL